MTADVWVFQLVERPISFSVALYSKKDYNQTVDAVCESFSPFICSPLPSEPGSLLDKDWKGRGLLPKASHI